jgi:hypothetical protein
MPIMKGTQRKTLELPRALWERISDYRHANKLRSERAAIEILMDAGLKAEAEKVEEVEK